MIPNIGSFTGLMRLAKDESARLLSDWVADVEGFDDCSLASHGQCLLDGKEEPQLLLAVEHGTDNAAKAWLLQKNRLIITMQKVRQTEDAESYSSKDLQMS
jgi:hypothetical protein